MHKIRIIGTAGSGKSYLAHALSKAMNIRSYDLDDFYFEEKYTKKRESNVRKQMVGEVTNSDSRIIEGVYAGDWCKESLEKADHIVYVTASPITLIKRLIKRELHKKTPLKHMIGLIRYALSYEKNNEDLQNMFDQYPTKIITLHKNDLTKEKIEKLVSTL